MRRILAAAVLSAVLFCSCSAAREEPIVYIDMMEYSQPSDDVAAIWDVMHVTSTLQGIVNRDAPRLFIRYVRNSINVDDYWWNMYRQEGKWLAGRDTLAMDDIIDVVKYFRKDVNGLVVYDPNVASTSNVASTIAGVEDLIAVRYDKTEGSMYMRLKALGLKEKVWLLNEDGTSRFTTKVEPYIWAMENYLEKGKCTGKYAAYYTDQYWIKNYKKTVFNHHQLTNHDFFVSQKAFFFDLSPWDDEPVTDVPDEPVKDLETMQRMLLDIYNINGGKEFCHIGGFPLWALKYTRDCGLGTHGAVDTEWQFAQVISAYNVYKDADAIGCGAFANASFWQHYPLEEKYPQEWTTRENLKAKGYIKEDGKVDDSKKYVLFYVGDYDASAWIYQNSYKIWDDPNRGSVPLMWCISPVLANRAPMVMDYFRKTATPNDYFAAADNGAGYLNPGMLQEPRGFSGLPSGCDAWAEHCKKYYDRWGLSITGFVIDGFAPGLNEEGLRSYSKFSHNGIVPQKVPLAQLYDGMPVMQSDWDINPMDIDENVETILWRMNRRGMPFNWFRTILKTPTFHLQLKEALEKADPSIVWLNGPEYFELLRCYLEEGEHGLSTGGRSIPLDTSAAPIGK